MAGARKGRERELLSFLPRAPKFPLPLLNACHAGCLGPESKMGRNSGRDAGCGMPQITIGITGLRENSGRDDEIEESYRGPFLIEAGDY